MSDDFASGKNAYALCMRCGFRHDYFNLHEEPGTMLRVCDPCNDGQFNRVTNPQNGPFPVTPDPQAIEWPFPDTNMAVDTSAEGGLPIQIGGENPNP